MSTTHYRAHRIPNNDGASSAHDPYGKGDCLEGHVPTHRQQDFSFLIIHPHAGRQGVYISISLKFGEEVIPRIKTVTDTLFLVIQLGNIRVHTLLFWKIKPRVDGRTCLAEKSTHLGLILASLKCLGRFFCSIFNSSKLCLGHALKQEKLQGHGIMMRMRTMETPLWLSSHCFGTCSPQLHLSSPDAPFLALLFPKPT